MPKLSTSDFLEWENQIRSGQGSLVRDKISQFPVDSLTRTENVKVANIARRVGLAPVALRLLRPIVHPPAGITSSATAEEKAEYASALIREGLVGEGLKILQTTNTEKYPEALLYTAFGLFTRWDYEAAIPLLERYTELAKSDYHRVLGGINLVAALLFTGRLADAASLLRELIVTTKKEELKLSHAFCLELSGQCATELKDFKLARQHFTQAASFTHHSATTTPFLVQKWLAIVDLLENNSPASVANLEAVKAQAKTNRDWETMRTCDLHLAIATQDCELAKFVYFGSPHRKFREKLKGRLSSFTALPAEYRRKYVSPTAQPPSVRAFDILAAAEIHSDIKLKSGQTLHRLLKVIASDFYRPVRATEIFSLVFRNEYFDPVTSINRVHQAIKRLRNWMEDSEIPLTVTESDNSYSLEATGNYEIIWPNKDFLHDENTHLNELFKIYGAESFTLNQASQSLGLANRSTSRLIKTALENEKLKRVGTGAHTRYLFL